MPRSLRNTVPAHAECQVCGAAMERQLVQCPSCETVHHADCWEYTGVCSTFACGFTGRPHPLELDLPVQPVTRPAVRSRHASRSVRLSSVPAVSTTVPAWRPSALLLGTTLLALSAGLALREPAKGRTMRPVNQKRSTALARTRGEAPRGAAQAPSPTPTPERTSPTPERASPAPERTSTTRDEAPTAPAESPVTEAPVALPSTDLTLPAAGSYGVHTVNGRRVLFRRSDPAGTCWLFVGAPEGWRQVPVETLARQRS